MSFHPDSNLPGCMMPDGGDCCVGYQALLADWRRLRVVAQGSRESVIEECAKVAAHHASGWSLTPGGLARQDTAEEIYKDILALSSVSSTVLNTPCQHAAIIGLDGMWHCQKCGDAIDMAVAHSSTDGNTP